MTLARKHPRTSIATVSAVVLLAAVAALASLSGSASRGALLNALERPAAPAAASSAAAATMLRGAVTVHAGDYTALLRLTPNRASVPNRISLGLWAHGHAVVSGARVTVVFGMPAMGMADAYSSPLAAVSSGVYVAHEPVLGMPGLWQLRLHVTPMHGAAFDLAVDDALVG